MRPGLMKKIMKKMLRRPNFFINKMRRRRKTQETICALDQIFWLSPKVYSVLFI